MEKTYYIDSYLKELKCKVVSIEKTDKALEVLTDKTIFYGECGGQPGDRGFLGSFEVLDTRKADNGDSVLLLKAGSDVQENEEYVLKLDWEHRYKYMVIHTAQHMLSGMLFTMFNIGTVSVHLGEDYLTIETNKEDISESTINELVKAANKAVFEGHKILYREMSHKEAEELGLRRSIKVEGDVRIVEIEGIDQIACGGVHVASTAEIGLITYYGHEQIRGHFRLFFQCNENALKTAFENSQVISEIKAKHSCGTGEILSVLNNIEEELVLLRQKYSQASKALARAELSSNVVDNVASFETELDIQAFGSAVSDFEDLAMCVINNGQWMIALKGKFEKIDFNSLRANLLPLIEAKGGGRYPLFQGKGKADNQKLFVEEFKKACKLG